MQENHRDNPDRKPDTTLDPAEQLLAAIFDLSDDETYIKRRKYRRRARDNH
jgi:hypothetical protein